MKKRTPQRKLYLHRESLRRVAAACPPDFDPPPSWSDAGEVCCCIPKGGGQVSFHAW